MSAVVDKVDSPASGKADNVDGVAHDGEDHQDREEDDPDEAGGVSVRGVGVLELELGEVEVSG